MNPQETEHRFLSSLAKSGQFDRVAAYICSNEPLSVRRKAADYLLQSLETLSDQDTADISEDLYNAALTEPNDTVRAKVIDMLIYLDDSAINTLVEKIESNNAPTPTDLPHPLFYTQWLDSTHVELRLVAVAGLGSVGGEQVAGKFAAACNDHDNRVRIRALEEIGRLGDTRCVKSVKNCIDSDSIDVRTAAAKALTQIGSREALKTVMPLAKDGADQVRLAIIEEIGAIGSLTVFGVILKAIDHDDETFRKAAIRATLELMAYGSSDDSDTVRTAISVHLQESPDRELVSELRAISTSESPEIRRQKIWLLGKLLDPTTHTKSLQVLIQAIADTDTRTAEIAVSQLIDLNDPVVIDHLEAFIQPGEMTSSVLQRADLVREQITMQTADDSLQNAVEYTKVTNPADYTAKHTDSS